MSILTQSTDLERPRPRVIVLLHNIRSAHNVGSIFRTADAVGVNQMYLTGYTPLPLDKFLRPQKMIAKTALGAELHIPWVHEKSPNNILETLRKEGYLIIGIEQDAQAHDYRSIELTEKVCVVMGNEVLGMSPSLRRACDVLAEIPMRGKKESLNVTIAFGVAVYRMLDR